MPIGQVVAQPPAAAQPPGLLPGTSHQRYGTALSLRRKMIPRANTIPNRRADLVEYAGGLGFTALFTPCRLIPRLITLGGSRKSAALLWLQPLAASTAPLCRYRAQLVACYELTNETASGSRTRQFVAPIPLASSAPGTATVTGHRCNYSGFRRG